MDRSEGVNVAVGALLVGIGAVILGLLAPVAAAVVAGVSALAGGYLIAAVYAGWPRLTTATERAFRPRLTDAEAHVTRIDGDDFVFRVSLTNSGRDDLAAFVNIIVPEFVSNLERCSAEGETGFPEHKGSFWRETERFWNGNVTFPGRMARLMFFRATLPSIQALQVRVKVFAPALNDLFDESFALDPTRHTATPAPAQAPERDGPAS